MVTGSKVRDLENDVSLPLPSPPAQLCDIRGERGVLTRVLLLRGRSISFFVQGSEGKADPEFQLFTTPFNLIFRTVRFGGFRFFFGRNIRSLLR